MLFNNSNSSSNNNNYKSNHNYKCKKKNKLEYRKTSHSKNYFNKKNNSRISRRQCNNSKK
jgi:hypothetical protein